MQYLRARYYKQDSARFMSEDTYRGEVGRGQSHNSYIYTENNPVEYVDKNGEQIADPGDRGGTIYYGSGFQIVSNGNGTVRIKYADGLGLTGGRVVSENARKWLKENGYDHFVKGGYSKKSYDDIANDAYTGGTIRKEPSVYVELYGLSTNDRLFVEKAVMCDTLEDSGLTTEEIKYAINEYSLEELQSFLDSGMNWSEWHAMQQAEQNSGSGGWTFPGWLSAVLEFALEQGLKIAISAVSGGILAAFSGTISAGLAGGLIFVIAYIAEAIVNGNSINFVDLVVGALVSALIAIVMDAAIGKLIDKVGPAIKQGFDSLVTKADNLVSTVKGSLGDGLRKISSTFKAVKGKIDDVIERIKPKSGGQIADTAFDSIDAKHVLKPKHNWGKVVDDPNDFNQVKSVMQKVLDEGTEYPHKGQYKKVLEIDGEVVEVTYRKVDGIITDISNGWVK